MSCHSVAVVLTLVQTKQIRIHINETIRKHSTNNTKHIKYKYTYYQNTHTLQKKLKQPQYKLQQPQYKLQQTQYKLQQTQYKLQQIVQDIPK